MREFRELFVRNAIDFFAHRFVVSTQADVCAPGGDNVANACDWSVVRICKTLINSRFADGNCRDLSCSSILSPEMMLSHLKCRLAKWKCGHFAMAVVTEKSCFPVKTFHQFVLLTKNMFPWFFALSFTYTTSAAKYTQQNHDLQFAAAKEWNLSNGNCDEVVFQSKIEVIFNPFKCLILYAVRFENAWDSILCISSRCWPTFGQMTQFATSQLNAIITQNLAKVRFNDHKFAERWLVGRLNVDRKPWPKQTKLQKSSTGSRGWKPLLFDCIDASHSFICVRGSIELYSGSCARGLC